jgi:hypothetical protein
VIVDDFHVVGVSTGPAETDAPLIIDANAVLTRTISRQLLQTVRRWNAKVEKVGLRRRARGVSEERIAGGWMAACEFAFS